MTAPNILALAKQGNPQAIAALMTHYFLAQDITTKASPKVD
jgi:hypothetical protein